MSSLSSRTSEYHSKLVIICICVNCALSSSIFGVPWAFGRAGWLLSLIISFISLIVLLLIGYLIVVILTRVDVLEKYKENGLVITHIPIRDIFKNNPASFYINNSNISESSLLIPKNFKNFTRKYDFAVISEMILGKTMQRVLIGISIVSTIFSLIACTSIFASSMVVFFPIVNFETCDIYNEPSFEEVCRYKYIFYIIVLGTILTIAIYNFKYSEHIWYFVVLFIGRLIAIIIMCATCLITWINRENLGDDDYIDADPELFDVFHFGATFPVIVLAIGFHFLIPDITYSLEKKEEDLLKVVFYSIFISFFLVILLGIITIFSINNIEPLITLNWETYSNGEKPSEREWWAYIIDGYISIFPAFDVIFLAYILLVNLSDCILSLKKEVLNKVGDDKSDLIAIKTVLLSISIVFPMVFYDLGLIFSFAGCLSLIFLLFFVPILAKASVILVPEKCVFDNFLTEKKNLDRAIVFNSVLLVMIWLSFIYYIFAITN